MLLTFLQGLSPWLWLGLGLLLLILEVFDAGGYLLWMALVATGLAVLLQVLPDFSWKLQLLLFVSLSTLLLLLWKCWREHLLDR
ncbi:NfeD family protein [Azorhizophilus paspali]|uniref:NfeD family protein n=1 Tax=Azorhizophilus paspali TaxID=69963 RepID=A0ABV6SPN3_AZOPA